MSRNSLFAISLVIVSAMVLSVVFIELPDGLCDDTLSDLKGGVSGDGYVYGEDVQLFDKKYRLAYSPDTGNTYKVAGWYSGEGYSRPWGIVEIPSTVKVPVKSEDPSVIENSPITVEKEVTSIGMTAFVECSEIASVILGGNIATIGKNAFQSCEGMLFVTMPESVVSIHDFAFNNTGLLEINIPSSVADIGKRAFDDCYQIESFTVDSGNNNYASEDGILFDKSKKNLIQYPIGNTQSQYVIPGGVKTIGLYAFHKCSKLTGVTLPAGLTAIDEYAFHKCSKLTGVTLPAELAIIGRSAFEGTGLTSIIIPASVIKMDSHAFSGCRDLASVSIGNGITDIGDFIFSNCAIKTIVIPDSVVKIGNRTFHNCKNLTSVHIGENLASIHPFSFGQCTNLEKFIVDSENKQFSSEQGVLYDHDKSILKRFPEGSKISSFTIPDSVMSVEQYGFYNAVNLTEITMPNTLKGIESYAFSGCSGLERVVFEGPIVIPGASSFKLGNSSNPATCTVYSPMEVGFLEPCTDEHTTITYEPMCGIHIDLNGGLYESVPTGWLKGENGFVKYVLEGGSVVMPDISPGREKYDFGGWDNTIPNPVEGDVTITAVWIPHKYSVTANLNGGLFDQVPEGWTQGSNNTYTKKFDFDTPYSEIFSDLGVPDKVGHKFDGFTPEDGILDIAGTTFTAQWTIKEYDIVFNDGTADVSSETLEYGTVILAPDEIPSKESTAEFEYEFTGWKGFTEGMTVSDDATFVAVFKQTTRSYDITWKWMDESGKETNATESLAYGTAPAKTVNGYKTASKVFTFKSWTPETETVSGDKTYTATYDSSTREYTITFEGDGLTVMDESAEVSDGDAIAYGTVLTVTAKPKTGHDSSVLANPGIVGTDGTYTVIGDVEFTVKHTAIKYTINWIVEGTTVQTSEVPYGETPEYTGDTPVRNPTPEFTYTFDRWNPGIAAVAGDTDYTAVFTSTVNKYTITWKADGNEITETYDYGATPSYKGSEPTKASTDAYDYVFTGWFPIVSEVTGNQLYKATFSGSPREYDITWNWTDAGGNHTETVKVEYGKIPEKSVNDYQTASEVFEFAEWTPAVKSVVGNAEYTATYNSEPREYVINWIIDGNTVKSESVEYGKTPEYTGDVPVRNPTPEHSFTFDKWAPDIAAVTGNTDYTAVFTSTVNKYTITFDSRGGDNVTPITDNYNTEIDLSKVKAVKTGHSFRGWSLTDDGNALTVHTLTENVTLHAIWEINQYAITLVYDNGQDDKVITRNYGTGIDAEPDPERTGHTFDGWDKTIPSTMPAENVTITAQWTINQYTVTFNEETITVKDGETAITPGAGILYNTVLTVTANPKVGYTSVVSASVGEISENGEYTVTGPVEFSVKHTVIEYTINWIVDGAIVRTDSVAHGNTPDYGVKTPTKKSTAEFMYIFHRWNPGVAAATCDADYTAIFTQLINKYTVSFNANGGEGSTGPIIRDYNTKIDLPGGDGFSRTGHTFEGWSLTADGSTITAHRLVGNVELYAIWSANEYTINFDSDGGSDVDPITLDYGTDIPIPGNPTKEGYIFAAWTPAIPATMPAGDLEITAIWVIGTYTITFNSDGGTFVDSVTRNYGSGITAPDNPTKEGHTFAGWNPSIPTTMPAENLTVKAQWEAKEYTITWKNNNIENKQVLRYGTTIIPQEDPVRASTAEFDYSFNGWTGFIENMTVTGDEIFTADFTATKRTYTMTWKVEGFEDVTSSVEYGTEPTYPGDIPTKGSTESHDYIFNGWSPALGEISEDAVYVAVFDGTLREYTVILDEGITIKDGDTEILSGTGIGYGTSLTVTADPKTGHTSVISASAGNVGSNGEYTVGQTVNFTITYTAIEYSITWTADGKTVKTVQVPYGETPMYNGDIPIRDATEKNTYNFKKWTPEIVPVTGDAAYSAVFTETINRYAIAWIADGTVFKTEELGYGETILAPVEIPIKESTVEFDYEFNGWIGFTDGITVVGNKFFVADFTATKRTYTMTWEIDGVIMGESQVEYGKLPVYSGTTPIRKTDQKFTYTFEGWTPSIATAEKSVIYSAVFTETLNEYTVTFDSADGSKVNSITGGYGTEISLSEVSATKTGYAFEGWSPDVDGDAVTTITLTEDVVLHAVWTVNEYTISFENDDGTVICEITQDYGTVISAPVDPDRTGHTFAGWNQTIPSEMPACDTTITAVWIINTYTITFNSDGGSFVDSVIRDYGTGITVPADPAKEGCTFVGWIPEVPETMPAENLTVKAIWEINNYIITFDSAGGSEIAPIVQCYGTCITVPEDPEKTGCVFMGWHEDAALSKTVYNFDPYITEDITLYANWAPSLITIQFESDGILVETYELPYGEVIEAPLGKPSKNGNGDFIYDFVGWNGYTEGIAATEDVTFTAVFDVRSLTGDDDHPPLYPILLLILLILTIIAVAMAIRSWYENKNHPKQE